MRLALALLLLVPFSWAARKKTRHAAPRGLHLEAPETLPQDFRDMGLLAYHELDSRAVAVFRDRLRFYRLPPGVYVGRRGLTDGARSWSLLELEPLKELRLGAPFDVRSAGNTLVCTHPALPKTAKEGLEDFCGVLSPEGETIFEFPVPQHMPEQMLQIVGIAPDGRYAEVYVGVFAPSPDGRTFEIARPREILGWRASGALERYDGPWSESEPRDGRKAMKAMLSAFAQRARRP